MLKGIIISYSRLVNNWMLFLSLQVLSKRVPNIWVQVIPAIISN